MIFKARRTYDVVKGRRVMVNRASSKQEKTCFEKLTSKKRHKGEDYVTSPFSEIIQLRAMTIKKKVMSKPLVMTIKRRLRRV